MCKAYKHLIFNHMGSCALGALMITLVKLPRLILMWMQTK